ncbi:hypothetical protein [Pseudomonas sp.]|uniref:hypothetical protein n=1 Tax=Pseudomonas sp. TaxID=306 RepID=UPI00272FB112|nr:hypothetical protein [Pseudomonas sp.]MDP2446584.1 hypothetical protein [Pseudomonas sp.]MDZ4334270.1 hypothetical protein [Pseudomonas sp.]
MNFINNYAVQVQLALGDTILAVPGLSDGYYTLSLSDARGAAATRWEHVTADVVSGVAYMSRGQEGTADQEWPPGSWLYCSLTAGLLGYIVSALEDLQARVYALENPVVPVEALTLTVYDGGSTLGYFDLTGDDNWVGEIDPPDLFWQGDVRQVASVTVNAADPEALMFQIALVGDVSVAPVSIAVQGIGVLSFAAATRTFSEFPYPSTAWSWSIDAHDWSDGVARVLSIDNG